jgi:hypothetical protein
VGGQKVGSSALTLALLASVATPSCEPPEAATGVHLTVSFSGMQIDQLAFSVRSAGGTPLEAMRPSTIVPGTWLSSPQDVVVYLPDPMAEQSVTCEANAMSMGLPLPARGQTDAVLRLHEMVEAAITLTAAGAGEVTPPATTPETKPPKGKKAMGPKD